MGEAAEEEGRDGRKDMGIAPELPCSPILPLSCMVPGITALAEKMCGAATEGVAAESSTRRASGDMPVLNEGRTVTPKSPKCRYFNRLSWKTVACQKTKSAKVETKKRAV
jgi:ribonuclease I